MDVSMLGSADVGLDAEPYETSPHSPVRDADAAGAQAASTNTATINKYSFFMIYPFVIFFTITDAPGA